jgi:hypothetical protein
MTTSRSGSIVLEPVTQAFIDQLTAAGGPPIYTLSPTAARAVLANAQAMPVEKAGGPGRGHDLSGRSDLDRCASASSGRRARAASCRS